MIVGADPKEGKGRGVVHTSNYEARKFGVKSGMPISKAWQLCPQGVYLRTRFDIYTKVSNEIMDILRKNADKFEQWGIDEAFLDVTSKVKECSEAVALARNIKKEIQEKENLTCSIGIGPNKLVAKIASDFHKPDGLTVVREEEAEAFLAPLSVRKLLWVGRKTEERLLALGVKTIGDLARFDPAVLTENFGVFGTQFHLMARGIDKSEVQERIEAKSNSREMTFEQDTSDANAVLSAMDRLAEQLHRDIVDQKVCFKTITIKVRYDNFETHTRGKTLSLITDRLEDLKKTARDLLRDYLKPDKRIRLIGVRISNFTSIQKQKRLA